MRTRGKHWADDCSHKPLLQDLPALVRAVLVPLSLRLPIFIRVVCALPTTATGELKGRFVEAALKILFHRL